MPQITLTDPDHPDALACLAAYFAELDATFPGGFDPGPPPHTAGLAAFLVAAPREGCVALAPHIPGTLEVKRLWVAPQARGQGLATALMAAAEDTARSLGASALVLDTNAALPGAVALYHRLGWTPIPRYNANPYAHHWFGRRL
jgi:GNAT superfamily N-acetyltransferase